MATTSHLRQQNQWRIVREMLQRKTASRAELGKATDMSQPTVSRIIEDLIADHIVQEIDDARADGNGLTTIGRPSKQLSLNRHTAKFLGIGLGVRQTRIAALPAAPPEQDRWDDEFPTKSTAQEWVQNLKKRLADVSLRGIDAAVISLPGVVNERTSQVLLSPNARWSEQQTFNVLLSSVIRKPVIVIQEIRALALGQSLARPDIRNFLLVDIGSGVGAAAVMDGELLRGALPISGEIGHTPIVGNDRPCSCGAVGCMETLVSRNGLLASSRTHGGAGTWPAFVGQLQKHGMPAWLRPTLDAVATTIAGAINMIGVRHAFVTGSIQELPEPIADYLCGRVAASAMWSRFGEVSCETATRQRQAGMVASALESVLSA